MSEQVTTIDPKHAEILTHMLGAGSHVRKSNHGYRNYFCAGVDGRDYKRLEAMEAAGLVKAGHTINDGTSQYFHSNLAGCQAIGLSKAAIKRAFKD